MKKIFLLLSLFIFVSSFSQDKSYEAPKKIAFQPMFSVGSSYYNSLGDIRGPNGNYLLGNMGVNTGIRMNITKDLDLSFLFTSNAKLYEKSELQSFETDINSIGFTLDYTLSNLLNKSKLSPFATIGANWMYFSTNSEFTETGVNLPIGTGISLDVSERIRFDIGTNYHLSFADLDNASANIKNNDNFMSVNFTIHYDLFTPKPDYYNYYDESNYTNINFKALDLEDSDSDGVSDIDDNCPSTPNGVKVDEFGCPYDGDGDGIPNYLDEELNTVSGAVVNERGVKITDEEYKSMYSDYEAASRKYAKIYNDIEINRDDFTSDNAYLIAIANAFNKKYNQETQDLTKGKRYKVQIGKFKDDIPSYLINKFLSYKDLESIPQSDGFIIYALGGYEFVDDAENRKMEIEINDREVEAKIIICEDGKCINYEYPIKNEISEEIVTNNSESDQSTILNDSIEIVKSTTIQKDTINKNTEEIVYRVQLGYFEKELSSNIFRGLNVIPIKKGKGTFYLIGSFDEYQDALIKQSEMKARGFKDAFIVTYKDGERINVSTAISSVKRKKEKKSNTIKKTYEKPKYNIQFVVQIGVWSDLNSETKQKIKSIGGAEKVLDKGDIYKYIVGRFTSLSEAQSKKSQAIKKGFADAFIYALKDGKRIRIKEALRLLNE